MATNFGFNINVNSNIDLNKLYKDFKNVANIAITTTNKILSNNYSNQTNKKTTITSNNNSNNIVETVDLSLPEVNVSEFNNNVNMVKGNLIAINDLVKSYTGDNNITRIIDGISEVLSDVTTVSNIVQKYVNYYDTYKTMNNLGLSPETSENIVSSAMKNINNLRGFDNAIIDFNNQQLDINFQKDINFEYQDMDMQKILNQLKELPNVLLKNLGEINVYDTFNPDNIYFANTYGLNNFNSTMSSNNNTINYYASTVGHEIEDLFQELAYSADKSTAGLLNLTQGRISDSLLWLDAIIGDNLNIEMPGIKDLSQVLDTMKQAESDVLTKLQNVDNTKNIFDFSQLRDSMLKLEQSNLETLKNYESSMGLSNISALREQMQGMEAQALDALKNYESTQGMSDISSLREQMKNMEAQTVDALREYEAVRSTADISMMRDTMQQAESQLLSNMPNVDDFATSVKTFYTNNDMSSISPNRYNVLNSLFNTM